MRSDANRLTTIDLYIFRFFIARRYYQTYQAWYILADFRKTFGEYWLFQLNKTKNMTSSIWIYWNNDKIKGKPRC